MNDGCIKFSSWMKFDSDFYDTNSKVQNCSGPHCIHHPPLQQFLTQVSVHAEKSKRVCILGNDHSKWNPFEKSSGHSHWDDNKSFAQPVSGKSGDPKITKFSPLCKPLNKYIKSWRLLYLLRHGKCQWPLESENAIFREKESGSIIERILWIPWDPRPFAFVKLSKSRWFRTYSNRTMGWSWEDVTLSHATLALEIHMSVFCHYLRGGWRNPRMIFADFRGKEGLEKIHLFFKFIKFWTSSTFLFNIVM